MQPREVTDRGAAVRIAPPLVFLGAIVTGLALWRIVPLGSVLPTSVAVPLGIALAGTGLALGFAAFRDFRRTGQDPAPWRPSPSLVVSGPFRLVRNPMYVGMTLLVLGIGIATRDAWIVALTLPALWLVHRTAVLPEEAYLRQHFGEEYAAYCGRVGRYLPRIRRRQAVARSA